MRHLVPLLVLPPLLYICGRLLVAPVGMDSGWDEYCYATFSSIDVEDAGWPWVYIRQVDTHWDTTNLSPADFHLAPLIADIAVLLASVILIEVLVYWRRRRRGSWLRFTMLDLLCFVAASAALIAWWVNQGVEHRREMRVIQELRAGKIYTVLDQYCGPEWLRRVWPVDRSRGDFLWPSYNGLRDFNRAVELQLEDTWCDQPNALEELQSVLRQLPSIH